MAIIRGTVYKRTGASVTAKQDMQWFKMDAQGDLAAQTPEFKTNSDGTYGTPNDLPAGTYWVKINGCTAIPGTYRIGSAGEYTGVDFRRMCVVGATGLCTVKGRSTDADGNELIRPQDVVWEQTNWGVDFVTTQKGRYNLTLLQFAYAVKVNGFPADPASHTPASGSTPENPELEDFKTDHPVT